MTSIKHFFTRKILMLTMALLALTWFSPEQLFSQGRITTSITKEKEEEKKVPSVQDQLMEGIDTFKKPSLLTQAAVLSILSMFPFIVMILTSFMKIVIVLSLLRNALGV